jgi:hypothetical protein
VTTTQVSGLLNKKCNSFGFIGWVCSLKSHYLHYFTSEISETLTELYANFMSVCIIRYKLSNQREA